MIDLGIQAARRLALLRVQRLAAQRATPTGRGFEAIDRSTWAGYAIHGIPEPTTYALMLLGLAGVGVAARRRPSRPHPPPGQK